MLRVANNKESTAMKQKATFLSNDRVDKEARKLPECHDGRTTHCVSPEEQDVYSAPVATPAPTTSPTFNPTATVTAAAAMVPEPTPITEEPSPPTARTVGAPSSRPPTDKRPTRPPQGFYNYTVVTKEPSLSAATNPATDPKIPTVSPNDFDTENPTFYPTMTTPPTFAPSLIGKPTEKIGDDLSEAPTPTRADNIDNNAAFVFPTFYPTDDSLVTAVPTAATTSSESESPFDLTPSSSTTAPTPTLEMETSTSSPILQNTDSQGSGNGNAEGLTSAPSQQSPPPTSSTLAPTTLESLDPPPTTAAAATTLQCKSNSNGNYGVTADDNDEDGTGGDDDNESTAVLVEYRYQVETMPNFEISEGDLNADILRRVEKAISDVLVASFFPPSSGHVCFTTGVAGAGGNATSTNTSALVTTATALSRGGHRQLQEASNNSTSDIVGLAADPVDQVLEGDLGVSCPFPLNGPAMDLPGCFVVGGGLSIFTAANQKTDDLSWVDYLVQAELEDAMNSGDLDDVDAAISFIRYIPPGTDLGNNGTGEDLDPTTTSSVEKGGSGAGDNALSSAPVWPWILGGFGFIGLAIAIIVMTAYRKRRSVEDANTFDSPTKSLASRGRGSPVKGRGSPIKGQGKGAFPIDIVDDNSEFEDAEIYQDDDDDEDDNSPVPTSISQPMSWRKVPEPHSDENEEYSRLEINATDPNQPVIRPVLDEESETFISNV